jgi:hypothetical protein
MFDFSDLDDRALELEARSLGAHLAAATCRWLAMLGELDRREAWRHWECRSMVHWLSWHCGVSLRTAREHLRVAHALATLPLVTAAFARGELSYSQVRALTRFATPPTEADQVDLARHATASQLDRLAAAVAQALSHDEPPPPPPRFAWRKLDDGDLVQLTFVVPGEHARTVIRALDQAAAALPAVDVEGCPGAGHDHRALPARRAAALAVLADHLLASEHPASRTEEDRVETVVVVDATMLSGEAPAEHGRCCDGSGAPLAASAAQRLACTSTVRLVPTDGAGNPLDYGRRARLVPRRVRRAVLARDRHRCRFPGCDATAYLDLHHVEEWVRDRGETEPENLVTLCWWHHRAVHERRCSVALTGGDLLATLADGTPVVVPHVPTTSPQHLVRYHRSAGPAIDHTTNASRWDGQPLRLVYATGAVADRIRR